ncbi:MAG: hypothetical protein LBG92_05570 [Prevotellaceae bacterium]|jgi:hypothetical protein|nr:hypothetical protein [Prevotellaceae bacterium]
MDTFINRFFTKIFCRRKRYELWAEDKFDYRNVERNCIAVFSRRKDAESALQQRRNEAGGEQSIIKFWILERE